MKIIDFEAHFLTPEFADYTNNLDSSSRLPGGAGPGQGKLIDMGEGRLKEMEADGIDMQVLSLFQPPHIQNFEPSVAKKWAIQTNDSLSAMVRKYPDKFVGLAAVPMQSPDDAVEELKRAVTELGLKGLCLMSNAGGEYYDDKKYWGVFETAEKLDVPVYLHPTTPSDAIIGGYEGYGMILSGPSHGYSADVSLHVLRLIHSGLFDSYPGLKMIIGHMGEGLPYWLTRLDFGSRMPIPGREGTKKKPSDYLKTNFTITTSGMFFQPALMCAYLALGADKIGFAVDYPPESNQIAVQFIKEAPICDSDKEKICHANAEALFKL